MSIEAWQDYECDGVDYDLFDDDMVHRGQSFVCAGCGCQHTAGVGTKVDTYIEDDSKFYPGSRTYLDLPSTAEDLATLRGVQTQGQLAGVIARGTKDTQAQAAGSHQ